MKLNFTILFHQKIIKILSLTDLFLQYLEQENQTPNNSLLMSICSIFFFMLERSYDRTKVSFFYDFSVEVINFTAAQFQFEIKSVGQLPLCFINILGMNILSSFYVKYGCLKASAAVILDQGSFCNIFLSRSTSLLFSLSNQGPVNTKSHYRFIEMISCAVFPIKRCLLKMM